MEPEHGDPGREQAQLERDDARHRLMMFVDAVYAISLTLLAIELRLPDVASHLSGADLLASLLGTWPKVLGYATSFTVIAIFWSVHHRLFRFIHRVDGRLLWLSLLQLGCIGFIPFPTSVIGEHLGDVVAEEFYFGTLALTVLISTLLWVYATSGRRLVSPHLSESVVRHYVLVPVLALVGFLFVMVGTPLGLGRVIEPLLLGYIFALGYILLAVFDYVEPGKSSSPRVTSTLGGKSAPEDQALRDSS